MYIEKMSGTHARVFWSGGSQAVRLPKALRVRGDEVLLRKRGTEIVIEQIPERDDWGDFWERLVPIEPMQRDQPKRADKRKAI
jgi:antitoxin VapB